MGEEIFSKELSTFKKEINFISNLYVNRKLPQTILFTGEKGIGKLNVAYHLINFILSNCLLYTSPSPRDRVRSRMPSSA